MTKLLINEYPLQVLPTLAKNIGLNDAIFLQQIHFWLVNPKVGKEHDGRKWVRNTVQEWQKDNFPFWHVNTIAKIANRLKDKGLIDSTSALNQMKADRTLWYTINYKVVDHFTQRVEGPFHTLCESISHGVCTLHSTQRVEPIPETTEITTESTSNEVEANASSSPAKKPNRKKASTAYVNPETGISTVNIKDAYIDCLMKSETNPVLNHASISKAAKVIAQAGHTPKAVTDTYNALKLDAWWAGKRISLQKVATEIGAQLSNGVKANANQPTNRRSGGGIPVKAIPESEFPDQGIYIPE